MSSSSGRHSDSPGGDLPPTLDVSRLRKVKSRSLDTIEATALREMANAWHEGLRTPAEQWLTRHPQLGAQPDVAVRIIYEEVCLREELGEAVDSEELYRRFPQWQEALEVL